MATSQTGVDGAAAAGAAGAAFTVRSAERAVEEARLATTATDRATRFIIRPLTQLRSSQLKAKNVQALLFSSIEHSDSPTALRGGYTNGPRIAKDHRQAELVQLRYFAGLTMEQTAECLGISLATANRWWNYARAWLHHEISGPDGSA